MARSTDQATYWFEVKDVRNISVKEYEMEWGGLEAMSGDLTLWGVLHIKPKGASWDVDFPFRGAATVVEEPRSGTVVYSVKDQGSVGRLVNMTLMDDKVERAITKGLGKLEYVDQTEATY